LRDFVNSDKRKIYNYLEINRLLYLKSPLKKAFLVLPSSQVSFIRRQTIKLSRADFKIFVLNLLDRLFIDYKLPSRKKEPSSQIKKRQDKYKAKNLKDKQRIQIYIDKKKFEELEKIRVKKSLTKQLFYSSLIENYLIKK